MHTAAVDRNILVGFVKFRKYTFLVNRQLLHGQHVVGIEWSRAVFASALNLYQFPSGKTNDLSYIVLYGDDYCILQAFLHPCSCVVCIINVCFYRLICASERVISTVGGVCVCFLNRIKFRGTLILNRNVRTCLNRKYDFCYNYKSLR